MYTNVKSSLNMSNIDSSFIIDDGTSQQDPSGFKKANVGATKGSSTTWIKIGLLVLVVALGAWMAYAARGASFNLEPSGTGQRLSVPSLGWSVTIPKGWKVERGATKEELVAFPGTIADFRAAIRENSYVKFSWSTSETNAKAAFADAAKNAKSSSAEESNETIGTPAKVKATRATLPAGGRVFVFIDGSPSLLVTLPKPMEELDPILASFARS